MNLTELADIFPDNEILTLEGMDEAIIGIEENNPILIYSKKKILDILCKNMSYEESMDYYDYNITRLNIGKLYVILCDDTLM